MQPVRLPEPYGSLLALLSDLHELAELHPAKDEFTKEIITDLKNRLEVLAALVIATAS
jgi:hypothetical protein